MMMPFDCDSHRYRKSTVCHYIYYCIMLLVATLTSPYSQADDVRPLYVALQTLSVSDAQSTGTNKHHYELRWRIPPLVQADNYPRIDFPADCQPLTAAPAAASGRSRYHCQHTLAGRMLSIDYPRFTPALSTVVKWTRSSQEEHIQLLRPGEHQWHLPEAESTSQVAWDYLHLGIEHIWMGWDHLLFVLCLLFIAGSVRRILITITGFTLAHSITLVLSALQLVRVPIAPVEAIIALSIVFLAVEIARDHRDSLTWRYPVAVSSSFGLLHGFGFAAALSEIGLPQTELITGLVFFNLGVEVGQVLFAGVVLGLMRLGGSYLSAGVLPIRWTGTYAIGGLGSFWLFERVMGFWL